MQAPDAAHAPATLRLFVALWPPAAVRDALLAHQAGWQWPQRAAPVAAGRLHVTLHFLGQVAADRLPVLARMVHEAGDAGCTLDLPAARPRVWHGGIAVLEVDAPAPLLALHARLGQALQALGLPVEARPWRPHVTLARRATGARPGPSTPLVPWRIDHGPVLMRTLPGGGYVPAIVQPGHAG